MASMTSYQLQRTNSSRFCADIVTTTSSSSPPQLLQKSVIGIGTRAVITPTEGSSKSCPCCTRPAEKCENAGLQELKAESSLYGLLQGDTSSSFTINRVLAEGWMEKKGTGNGWFGSTTWKQRWVQLALTSIPGYDLDVPVLHVYWHDSLPKPSMSLNLEKTVVMAGYEQNKPIFNIIHVAGGGPNSAGAKENMTPMGFVPVDAAKQAALASQQQKVTRTFSASGSAGLADCQEWVKHIAEAMHDYEKRKRDKKIRDARPKGNKGALLPRSPTSARRRQMLMQNNMTQYRGPTGPSKAGTGLTQPPHAPEFPQIYDL